MKTNAPSTTPVLEFRNLGKTFSGVQVLQGVNLSVNPGEIHGLLGENGSGKSTLIKVIAGVHVPDAGSQMFFNGQELRFPLPPGQFRELGISFVHQDLGLVEELTVLENMRIGKTASQPGFKAIRWRREGRELEELFRAYGVDVSPHAKVSDLESTERAIIAIVRAVEEVRSNEERTGHGLLILDEPTVFLPQSGVERIFGLVNEVVRQHASVIFVSHDIDEVKEHTDRATILRNGKYIDTIVTGDTTAPEIVSLIIGRQLENQVHNETQHGSNRTILKASDVSARQIRSFDLDLCEGEIVGLTGLVGSGYEVPLYALFGHISCDSGTIAVADRRLDSAHMTPVRAMDLGMALIPANRKTDGSVGSLSVAENMMLLNLAAHSKYAVLDRERLKSSAQTLIEEYDVRPPDASKEYETLSGGNQQKVVLAKWLQMNPRVVLLDEPTQGVDIGAREQILGALVDRAQDSGAAVLCASSDYDQLARICHRVLIFEKGRVVAELKNQPLTKDLIANAVLDRSMRTHSPSEMSA